MCQKKSFVLQSYLQLQILENSFLNSWLKIQMLNTPLESSLIWEGEAVFDDGPVAIGSTGEAQFNGFLHCRS